MKQGKVPESVLKRSVLKLIQQNKEMAMPGPGIGEDSSVLHLPSQYLCACTVDPVIGDGKHTGFRAVHTAVNNLAASGAEPVAVMPAVLLPVDAEEQHLKQIMRGIQKACGECSVSVLGGHTESTEAVVKPVITMTGIGYVRDVLQTGGAKPGQDIVMTKYAAIEGTALIAEQKKAELATRYSRDFIDQARDMIRDLSILKEAKIAKEFGVSAMHDVHKGGIYGALWEFASASGTGIRVILERIPMRQETVEICEFYDLNPYRLFSGGSLLITTDKGYELAEVFKAAGVPASVIGKITNDQKRIIVREEEDGFLEPPKSDEIYLVKQEGVKV